jgi:hypothetical protein
MDSAVAVASATSGIEVEVEVGVGATLWAASARNKTDNGVETKL